MLAELLAVARLKQGQQGTIHQEPDQASSISDFELAIGMEVFATGIEAFEPLIVTGLLQTEAYARVMISYHAEIAPSVDVEQSVALRLRRQEVITRDRPVELWCVIEEQALRRPIGNSAVMAGQLDHLLAMTQRSNVTLQVIPQSVGLHPGLYGACYLLRFNDDWRIAYDETRRSAYYHDAPEAIEDYERVMNHLRHLALNPKRSRALVAQIRKEVGST